MVTTAVAPVDDLPTCAESRSVGRGVADGDEACPVIDCESDFTELRYATMPSRSAFPPATAVPNAASRAAASANFITDCFARKSSTFAAVSTSPVTNSLNPAMLTP
jgi:hypothetical protein